MNLKEQLRYFLNLRKMTAAELARRSQVSAQTISIWQAGGTPKDVIKIKQVADALGTGIDNLLYGHGLTSTHERTTELENIFNEGGAIKGIFEIQIKMVKNK